MVLVFPTYSFVINFGSLMLTSNFVAPVCFGAICFRSIFSWHLWCHQNRIPPKYDNHLTSFVENKSFFRFFTTLLVPLLFKNKFLLFLKDFYIFWARFLLFSTQKRHFPGKTAFFSEKKHKMQKFNFFNKQY